MAARPVSWLAAAVASPGSGARRSRAVCREGEAEGRRAPRFAASAEEAAALQGELGQRLPSRGVPRANPASGSAAKDGPARAFQASQGCSCVRTAEIFPARSQYLHSSSAAAAASLLPQITAHPIRLRSPPAREGNPRAATTPRTPGFEGSGSTGSQELRAGAGKPHPHQHRGGDGTHGPSDPPLTPAQSPRGAQRWFALHIRLITHRAAPQP